MRENEGAGPLRLFIETLLINASSTCFASLLYTIFDMTNGALGEDRNNAAELPISITKPKTKEK